MKTAITEKMKVHEEWYKEAKKQSLQSLPEFLRHLMDDYKHDYGTICHAISAGAIATAWAMNDHPQGGITGFQAGFIMWGFIRYWNHEHNKTGLSIVDYDNMLYPQYEYKFDKTISKSTWDAIQKTAAENIRENKTAHPSVIAHWHSIVSGVVPFGYVINEEQP